MRILVSLYIFVFVKIVAFAIPARPVPVEVIQHDGSVLRICLRGDEFFHYTTTIDNVPVLMGTDGQYYYATTENDNLMCSHLVAHESIERNPEENKFIRNVQNRVRTCITNTLNARPARKKKEFSFVPTRVNNQPYSYLGKKKGLVVLVDFADLQMVTANANNEYSNQFNQEGYSNNYHIGSVHDYFYDQSYGKFDLTFDVIGPVAVSKEYAHYGRNSSWNSQSDNNVWKMVTEACYLADEYVNFADYDWDGDGEVEQVFFIYAGYGESSGAPSNTIWPHEFSLSGWASSGEGDGAVILDGVKIDTYACSCELSGTSGDTMMGIGVACHEFSHCLGIPDFYDVDYNGGFGMDSWDIMDSGSYNGPQLNGEVPSGYTAYERWYAGWLDFYELNKMERIKGMPDLGQQPFACIFYNDNNPNEYFILENRQNVKWFQYVGTSTNCHGLLITHTDYSPIAWMTNNVNTIANHQRMSIVPADNDYGKFYFDENDIRYTPSESDLEGDLFPGLSGTTEFTDISHVNVGGKFYNPSKDGSFFLDKPITNIKESNGLISFDFMGGIYVPQPQNPIATNEAGNSVSVIWDMSERVDSCILEMIEVRKKSPLESLLLTENFSGFKQDSDEYDGILDLSTYLNSYMQTEGWTGKNVFTSPKGAKIGDESVAGYIMTPFVESNAGSITVKWNTVGQNDSFPIVVSIINERNDTVEKIEYIALTEKETRVYSSSSLPAGYYAVHIQGDRAFYLDVFTVYDGTFSENELSFSALIGAHTTPIEKYFISGITDNKVTIMNLKAKQFQYRIKAMRDEASSLWTDWNTIVLENEETNMLKIESNTMPVRIYDLFGNRVNKPLKYGVYIVDDGHKRIKVVKAK